MSIFEQLAAWVLCCNIVISKSKKSLKEKVEKLQWWLKFDKGVFLFEYFSDSENFIT